MGDSLEFLPPHTFAPLDMPSGRGLGSGWVSTNQDEDDSYHPFKVYIKVSAPTKPDTANGKVGVEYKSTVYKDANLFSKQTLSGLLTDRFDKNDSGWETFPSSDKIVYLKGTVSGGTVTAIDIDWDQDPDQLDTKKRLIGGTPCTVDNQTEFFCPIAKVFRYGQKPEKLGVDQYVFTHLMLRKVTFGDDEGWYPCPGPGGGGSAEFPWDIKVSGVPPPADDGTYSSYKAIIVPGLIGGILPSNYDDEFTVNSGVTYGIVECTTNGEAVTSATISFNSTFPTPESATADKAPTSFKVCFGMVDKSGSDAPLVFDFWKTSKSAVPNAAYAIAPTTPNDPTKYYYVWRVG